MVSKLKDYAGLEERLKKISEEMELLEKDEDFKKELAFKKEIEKVLEKHGFDREAALNALGGVPFHLLENAYQNQNKKVRKKRTLKVYENPHTGETLETRGGNNTKLKEWKSEYGEEAVLSWVTETLD